MATPGCGLLYLQEARLIRRHEELQGVHALQAFLLEICAAGLDEPAKSVPVVRDGKAY